MDAASWLVALLLGGLVGLLGQGARSIVGMKKLNDDAVAKGESLSANFDTSQFFISLMIGFIAGALAMAGLVGGGDATVASDIGSQTMTTVFAAGYAGADFIEGFINRNVPRNSASNTAPRGPDQPGAEPPAYG